MCVRPPGPGRGQIGPFLQARIRGDAPLYIYRSAVAGRWVRVRGVRGIEACTAQPWQITTQEGGVTVSVNPTEGILPRPWRSIWTRPRATIQRIVETEPERHVMLLAALTGVVQTCMDASNRNLGDRVGPGAILGLVLVLGPVVGVISVYLWAALLRWTGRWIGGQGSTVTLRAALAWASVPMITAGVLLIPVVLIAGKEFFTEETPLLDQRPTLALVLLPLILAQIVAAFWTVVAMCKTIGQVQGFSAWKALGNSALAGLVVAAPFIVLGIVIGVLSR